MLIGKVVSYSVRISEVNSIALKAKQCCGDLDPYLGIFWITVGEAYKGKSTMQGVINFIKRYEILLYISMSSSDRNPVLTYIGYN